MLNGIDVVLYKKTQSGTDGFGAPIYTETSITVNDVLVCPSSSTDIPAGTDLTGKKEVYTLCIPKGDINNWLDAKVGFFGKTFKAFGFPQEYIENNIPLRWNKKIMVERYE